MHPRLDGFSLATLTLLFSLATPVYGQSSQSVLPRTSIKITEDLAQVPSAQDRKIQAEQLLQQGIHQFRSGQFRAALQTYQKALIVDQPLGDSPNGNSFASRSLEAEILNNIGAVYIHLSQYSKALETLQQALVIRKEIKDRQGEG